MDTNRGTEVEKLAAFIESRKYEDISADAVSQLKIRILDSLGAAFGALEAEPIAKIRNALIELGGNPLSTLIGSGSTLISKLSPDRAAFYNGALIRYLDFNDSFLARGETCHPSDNFAPVFAATEYMNGDGKTLLTALAIAYQIQIRMSELAPVRNRGFDHTTQGAYAVAGGVSKALGLDQSNIAHAIAMSATSNNALRVTRTGALSHWKGLAYPEVAFTGTYCAFLAMYGITGPLEVFEGNKGFQESIAGPFQMDWWKEDLEAVKRTILKKYNAEIHSQSAIDAILELKREYLFQGPDVDSVELETFQVAYDIIGGGEEGAKTWIRNKEEADHSLPYLLAVAILDGEVLPQQFTLERIQQDDVQHLLKRIKVYSNAQFSMRFPKEMPARIKVRLVGGETLEIEKSDYEGFLTQPFTWSRAEEKFKTLSMPFLGAQQCDAVIDAVAHLERLKVADFAKLLVGPSIHHTVVSPIRPEPDNNARAFSFVPIPDYAQEHKPRKHGMTEIRGPYYSVMGPRYLTDILETMGRYVDGLKFAGGSFALMPREQVRALIDIAHQYNVYVSTGGWIEYVLTHGPEVVNRYIDEAKELGFDVVELSMGFITLPMDDLLRLIERVNKTGMKAKPELGIQFGAGGATRTAELEALGTRDVGGLISQARRCLDAGASVIMIESEGITENVKMMRTDVITQIVNGIGLEHAMFEAADPEVFQWYIKNYGTDVNLFVDHSQIVQLQALRSGIWGTQSTWGRITSYPASSDLESSIIKKSA